MVLLSGKRKGKDALQEKIVNRLIQPYLDNNHLEVKENILCMSRNQLSPFYKQIIDIFDKVPLQTEKNGDLTYQLKTTLKIKPEYEIYHLLFGKKEYNEAKIDTIKDCLTKKYSFSKIKCILNV
jgi:hypothetical protein